MPNYNLQVEVTCPNCKQKRFARGDKVRKAQKEGKEFWCLPCRNRTRVHLPRKYVGTKEERKKQAAKAWRDNNTDKVLSKRYSERYGITFVEYKSMLQAQNHKCAICGVDEKESKQGKLVVDHNHLTKAVRGLLCHNCNCGLGHFRDEVDQLQNAIRYLQK